MFLSEEHEAIVVGLTNYPERKKPDLVLYLDDVAFPKLPESAYQGKRKRQEGVTYRQFFLGYKQVEQKEAWRDLYKRNGRTITEKATVDVAIGLANERLPVTADPRSAKIYLVSPPRLWLGAVLIVLLFGVFVVLVRRTRIIRAPAPASLDTQNIPYSLGRTQMAIWFFLVASSYAFIWIVTGEINSITYSAFVLLGIGAATAIGAAVLDTTGSGEQPLSYKSHGFLKDVISDGKGVTFHRFQILGWTLVLGVVYIVQVLHTLSLPKFDLTTLGLMGISSGTYLGFKFPEPKQDAT